MNQKFSFLLDQKIEPILIKKKQHTECSKIVEDLEQHFDLRGELNSKWNYILNFPEYEVICEEDQCKIKCLSDNMILASVTSKELADNIAEVMNLAYREGAKQIIHVLENL